MTKKLRKLSIRRRMFLFFGVLCLFPLLLLICFSRWSGWYQAAKGEQQFTHMYLEQGRNQLNAYLEEYEQKAVYLTENPDLQADIYLYYQDSSCRADTASRIKDILYHACREEAFFDYGAILSEDGSVFLEGQNGKTEAAYYEKLLESGRPDTEEAPVFITGDFGEVYLSGLLRTGLAPEQITCYLFLKCNMDAFEELVSLLKRTQEQTFCLTEAKGKILFGEKLGENREKADTIALKNGWALSVSESLPAVKQSLGIQELTAAILLLFSAACMYLLGKSLTTPLGQIMKKMQRAGLGAEEPIHRPGQKTGKVSGDEHHMLEQKLTEMIRKQRELQDKMYRSRIGEEKMQMHIKELELNAMQQQINPHFLLNVLETIYWMAEEKGYEQTGEMIAVLGDYFKLCVSTAGEFVTIREEIENAKSYLQILALLYEKKFEIQWETDTNILDGRTIKLILQPVIENAFEHGIRSMKQGGHIRITGRRIDNKVEFQIEDNGRGMTKERLKEVTDYMRDSNYDSARSVGTKNVNLRIRLYYGDAYGLFYESKEGEGTRAVIRIPWETGDCAEGQAVIRN